MGTEIFPLSPKQEKLYHAVATDGPIDHFDGDMDESFSDDIKTFMSQVLVSQRPNNQKKSEFLVRWNNDYNEDWAQKFPHATHRIFERSSRRIHLTADEQAAASFSVSPNLYDTKQVSWNYDCNINFLFLKSNYVFCLGGTTYSNVVGHQSCSWWYQDGCGRNSVTRGARDSSGVNILT